VARIDDCNFQGGELVRILIAGATGAIGRPLIRCLDDDHHGVFALARSPESSRMVTQLGAEAVPADALDASSIKAVIERIRPDAVINELTSLPRRTRQQKCGLPPNGPQGSH
jgi:2-alkyl-3-oxoalkanoate reductase